MRVISERYGNSTTQALADLAATPYPLSLNRRCQSSRFDYCQHL